MKTLKQIQQDPRVWNVEMNPDWDPEAAKAWPDMHPSKYFMYPADGYMFDDGTHFATADTVKELNALLAEIVEDDGEGFR